jgi:hypothetical protein
MEALVDDDEVVVVVVVAVAVAVADDIAKPKKIQVKMFDDDADVDNHKPSPNHRPAYVSVLEEPS